MIATAKIIRPRAARPSTARGPRFGVVGALALHAAIVGAALLSWNRSLDMSDKTPIVPVDLVTIAQKTDVAPMQIQKPPPEAVTPPPLNLATVPTPPDVRPPDVEIAPDTKPAKAPTKKELLLSFQQLLDEQAKPEKGARGARNIQGNGSQMAADLESALVSQVYRCWSPVTGVPHAEDMIVTVKFSLARDGSLLLMPPLQSSANFGGAYQQAAIEAAERAIQTCGPYKLPGNRYSEWRQATLVFDPRNQAGQ